MRKEVGTALLRLYSHYDFGREMLLLRYKLAVVPAHAGTHNHGLEFVALRRDGFLSNNEYHAVWVPACAGTTDEIAFRDM